MAMMNPTHRDALKQVARLMREDGRSLRHIARALGIHRHTVKKLLRETEAEATTQQQGQAAAKATGAVHPQQAETEAKASFEPQTETEVSSVVHAQTETEAKTLQAATPDQQAEAKTAALPPTVPAAIPAETPAPLSPGNPSAPASLPPAETPSPTQTPPILPAADKTPKENKKSKLDDYRLRILELAKTPGLTNKEIRRIIRKEGYTGGKTILDDFLREHRERKTPRAFMRYEPLPGHEAQMDWSPYTVEFPGESGPPIKVKVHVFSLILSYSRYQYLEVFLDEKQDTLFQGHVEAFHYFGGVPVDILYDNQKVVTLGRLGGKVLLHPRFESFAAHYGFTPNLCLPRDPERKGRVERPFGYLETSFFPGRKFRDLQDLRQQLRSWLEGSDGEDAPSPEIHSTATPSPDSGDVTAPPEPTPEPPPPAQTTTLSTDEQTGNHRIHGTTRQRPVDRWAEEKPLLIALPPADFLPTRIEHSPVARDCTVAVLGCRYTVPPDYVGQTVTVLITPKAIRFYNQCRELIAEHAVSPQKGKLVINEEHYEQLRKARKRETRNAIEERFLALFPDEHAFLEGLRRQLKPLVPIHLKQLDALLERFTRDQVRLAIRQAIQHGACTGTYVEEVLRRQFPSQFSAHPFDQKLEKPAGLTLGHLEIGDAGHFDNIFNDASSEHVEQPLASKSETAEGDRTENVPEGQTDHPSAETGPDGQTDTQSSSTPTDERSQS